MRGSAKPMKKDQAELADEDMLPEYDFSGGVRGKHYRAFRQGYTVRIHKEDGTVVEQRFSPEEGAVVLEPDVREYFPDSESVNKALRSLIVLIPTKRRRRKAAA